MRKSIACLLAVAAVAAISSSAFAGGANVYPNGAEGFWVGAAPPPGFYYLNYDLWYAANEFKNDSGKELGGPLAGFKTDVIANVSRFLYISDKKILGANWGTHIFIVFQDVNTKSAIDNVHVSGLGDTIIDPFILAWHWPNFHITAGIDIYVPTGDYDEGRLVNLGCNAFIYEPVLAFSYMTPVKGLTVSAKLMYDLTAKNNDYTHPIAGVSGDIEYGQEFHCDYSIDYMVNQSFKAGIGGYYYQQTTKDKINGVSVSGNKGRVWSIGPGIEYAPARFKGRLALSYRAQFEMDARNRPEGIANWLKAVWAF